MTGDLERFLRRRHERPVFVHVGMPTTREWIRALFGAVALVDPWQVRLLEERLDGVRVAQAGWDEAGIRERYSRGRP